MAATMIADGGELTIVRPLAAWVWGVWEVTHDDDAAPEDLIDERKLGFVGALDHPPAGRFGRLPARRFGRPAAEVRRALIA